MADVLIRQRVDFPTFFSGASRNASNVRISSCVMSTGDLASTADRRQNTDVVLLKQTRTNRQIAAELAMMLGTVAWRLNRLFSKLNARNRIEALAQSANRMARRT